MLSLFFLLASAKSKSKGTKILGQIAKIPLKTMVENPAIKILSEIVDASGAGEKIDKKINDLIGDSTEDLDDKLDIIKQKAEKELKRGAKRLRKKLKKGFKNNKNKKGIIANA